LDYDVPGNDTDVCYESNPVNCQKYGRLYNWVTAMGLPAKCNGTLSTSDAACAISTPHHRGICPANFHIPTNAEWDALMRYADGTSGTESPYDSPTAGKFLKAREGWNSGGNGTDEFGFAAKFHSSVFCPMKSDCLVAYYVFPIIALPNGGMVMDTVVDLF